MKAFIFTGGDIIIENMRELPQKDDLTIAADAGLLTAKSLGVKPQILIGDFDSLGVPDPTLADEIITLPPEKDDTDTQLAVKTALERGADEIVIIGGLSGRLDHTLSNLAILEHLYEHHVRARITDGQNRVRFLRNDGVILPHDGFRYLSLIAADPVVKGVSLDGCKYPLKKAKLTKTNQYAVSNEIEGNCALIEIRRGGVWIIESND
jgi:thiamine pyrophosphokinase